MKKAVSIVLTVLTIMLTVSPCAFAIEAGEQYTFVDAGNSIIYYYLDENGHEYVYKDGQKMYILLPLDKYRMTESEATALENSGTYTAKAQFSSQPFSSTYGYVIISTLFNSTVYFPTVTGYLNYPANADCLRLKTSNHSPWYVGHKLNVHLYVKSRDDGSIYDYHYFDQSCSITKGYTLSGRFAEKVNVSLVTVSEMASCTLAVTATEG